MAFDSPPPQIDFPTSSSYSMGLVIFHTIQPQYSSFPISMEHLKFIFTSHFFNVRYIVRRKCVQDASVFLHIRLYSLMF